MISAIPLTFLIALVIFGFYLYYQPDLKTH